MCMCAWDVPLHASMFQYYILLHSGTTSSCGIVAGAAALVLEKFPHYTPQQVREYLIDQSTPGVVDKQVQENT